MEKIYQGYLMETPNTRRWTKKERLDGEYEEQRRLFKNQSSLDDGKSRILVSVFHLPEEARDAMIRYNKAVDDLMQIEKEIFNV